jgi:hypothetical protein
MYYVQYYQRNSSGELQEAIGDRGVVILDGRNSLETMKADAIANNGIRRPIFDGYRIFKGDSFTRSAPITKIIELDIDPYPMFDMDGSYYHP